MLLTTSVLSAALLVAMARVGAVAEYLPQTSPIWLSAVPTPVAGSVATAYPKDEAIKAGPLQEGQIKLNMKKYPEQFKLPPAGHPEVKKVMEQIDWSKVPQTKPRKVVDYTLDIKDYDTQNDPDCWWSSTNCKQPKLDYLPEDIYQCPNAGEWGLNYDDGPYKVLYPQTSSDKQWEQPRFYNYLVEHGKQKATLFFVGSNVAEFPAAARRALNDGHTLCSHTWSHPQMTSLSNEQVVAQLYWTQKAIKEATGVTPKCWRPPYGDVDDRVRAIAWLMGMRTILWDQDSNDWNMLGTPAKGTLSPDVVDSYFQKWIEKRGTSEDVEHGHITLQHENSNATIAMAERWLPKLQEHFKVMPIHQCINDPHPYWEENWVYPTLDTASPRSSNSSHENDKSKDTNTPTLTSAATTAMTVTRAWTPALVGLCLWTLYLAI